MFTNTCRRLYLALALITLSLFATAKDYKVHGPQGGVAMEVTLPDGFDKEKDSCPMVILMHGIFSSMSFTPMPALAKELAGQGIASIRFDFGGHWKSEGKMEQMTVEKEIADAMAMWEYAKSLPYISRIGLLGHSQGGVVASMTAGRLSLMGDAPECMVLLAPGSVIKDACINGKFFNARFDPADPPEYVKCFGMMKLGREYLLTTQELDIYCTAEHFDGPVRIIHGSKDDIVPMRCSEDFMSAYGNNAELIVVENGNHMLTKRLREFVRLSVEFFARELK